MAAHGTEVAGCEAGEVERPETAHRDATDRDPPAVSVEARNCGRDHLLQHIRAPAGVRAVVEVRVVAAVDEDDDRRAAPELLDCLTQCAADHVVGGGRSSMEQKEQRPPLRVPRWQHDRLLHAPPDEPALDGEVC
jgi:hypothetical protein